MAVVEAMLCEVQIAARLQTEWDDLELPEVDEDWRKRLADRMPSPRSRRLRRVTAVSGLVALVGIACALYFGLRRPKEIFTPVYVEVTKTDEAETVAPWLGKAGIAAADERFLEPASDSALYYIERAEREAKKLGTASGGAELLRRLYGNQFRSLGNALLEAKLTDLAALRFGQALRFLPGDADLRSKLDAIARAPADRDNGTASSGFVARKQVDDTARLAAELFSDVGSGRYSQARVTVARLLEVDKDRRQTARLADEFRRRAGALWESGKHEQGGSIYQIVAELDGQDLLARARGSGRDDTAVPGDLAPPREGEALADETKGAKRKVGGINDATSDSDFPRDRTASAKAVAEGGSALARGDLGKAQVAFDRAVRADATNPEAVAGLAEVAFENARYSEALDYGRRAVHLHARVPRYHVVVGDSYFKLFRYDEALAAYRRAAALAPQDGGIRERIGRVMARLGQ
jgi:tetratricopeptide (TPR) repeat protein